MPLLAFWPFTMTRDQEQNDPQEYSSSRKEKRSRREDVGENDPRRENEVARYREGGRTFGRHQQNKPKKRDMSRGFDADAGPLMGMQLDIHPSPVPDDIIRRQPDKIEQQRSKNPIQSRTMVVETSQRIQSSVKDLEQDKKTLIEKNHILQAQILDLDKQNKELERKLQEQTEEIRVMKESLRREGEQRAQINQLLNDRTKELVGAQVFLTKADTISGADIIAKVEMLNSEVFQTAALVVDLPLQQIDVQEPPQETIGQARRHIEGTLNPTLIQEIISRSKQPLQNRDPLPVQIALQGVIVWWLSHLIGNWYLLFPEKQRMLQDIYARLRNTEPQAVFGRWRALTSTGITIPEGGEVPLINSLSFYVSQILTLSGISVARVEAIRKTDLYQGKLAFLVKAGWDIKKTIGEGITSADIKPVIITPAANFDRRMMDDAYSEGREAKTGSLVACTTEIGLDREVMIRSETGDVKSQFIRLLKPKVVLVSSLHYATDHKAGHR